MPDRKVAFISFYVNRKDSLYHVYAIYNEMTEYIMPFDCRVDVYYKTYFFDYMALRIMNLGNNK